MLLKIIAIVAGGGLGALLRFTVYNLASKIFVEGFPWGTLLVNLVGCLLIGLLFSIIDPRIHHPAVSLFFITGFLGALTTFSTFALDGVVAAQNGLHVMVIINILANNVGGIIMVLAGMWLGGMLVTS